MSQKHYYTDKKCADCDCVAIEDGNAWAVKWRGGCLM